MGQGARVIVGIKKHQDEASVSGKKWEDWFEMEQLLLSLIIAFIIGGIAGVLGGIWILDTEITKESMITLTTIGYAGTDFIEGFMKTKNSYKMKLYTSALSPNRAYLATVLCTSAQIPHFARNFRYAQSLSANSFMA